MEEAWNLAKKPLDSDPNAFNSRFSENNLFAWGNPTHEACYHLSAVPAEAWACLISQTANFLASHLRTPEAAALCSPCGPELSVEASTSASGSCWHAGHRREFSYLSVGNRFLCGLLWWCGCLLILNIKAGFFFFFFTKNQQKNADCCLYTNSKPILSYLPSCLFIYTNILVLLYGCWALVVVFCTISQPQKWRPDLNVQWTDTETG